MRNRTESRDGSYGSIAIIITMTRSQRTSNIYNNIYSHSDHKNEVFIMLKSANHLRKTKKNHNKKMKKKIRDIYRVLIVRTHVQSTCMVNCLSAPTGRLIQSDFFRMKIVNCTDKTRKNHT